jgi:hypothetical protein
MDLVDFQELMIKKIESLGMQIYPCSNTEISTVVSQMEWEGEDYNKFLEIAHGDNIKIIFMEVKIITRPFIQSVRRQLVGKDPSGKFSDDIDLICVNLEEKLDEIYSISFSWIKDNVMYSVEKNSETYFELEKQIGELSLEQKKQIPPRVAWEEMQKMPVPKELEEKGPEKIAQELIDYVEIESPEFGLDWNIENAFWERKNLNNSSPSHRMFRSKVKMAYHKILDDKEKESIPDWIEKCVEWALKNEIDKPSQTILRGFLADKGVSFSANNFKILHTKVTLQLKSLK